MREINKIIVHCSDSPKGRDDTASDIDRWHKQRGWVGIGYHYVVRLDGKIEKGRPEEKVGAHCKNHNQNSIGVCYIGGWQGEDTRTPEQKEALVKLLKELKSKYPNAKIYGHNYFDKGKTCPNFCAEEEYKNI